jgi:Villin headpiece domain
LQYEWEQKQQAVELQKRRSIGPPVLKTQVSSERLGIDATSVYRLFIEAPEKQGLEIQTTATPDTTVEAIRQKVIIRAGLPETNASFQLYLGSLRLENQRQLRDYRFDSAGEHLWFREVPPYQPDMGDIEAFKNKVPKDLTPNQQRLFSDLRITSKGLNDKRNLKVVHNIMQEAFYVCDKHNPNKLDEVVVHEVVPYKVLKNPKKRPTNCRGFELEKYLARAEFKVVFDMDREDFNRLPPWKKWKMKMQKDLAM